MEKVVMACVGKYLVGTGIDKVRVNTEVYGPISKETDIASRQIFYWEWQSLINLINLMNV